MKKLVLALMVCLQVFGTFAKEKPKNKNNATPKDTRVLFSVGNTPVTVEEFKYIYNKNNARDSSPSTLYSRQKVNEYLDLFINFKLRIEDAKALGLDTATAFTKEYYKYRQQIAQPYLTDRTVNDMLIEEAYTRMGTEVRASHILVLVDANAKPKDTLEAYNKAVKLRDSLVKYGKSFPEMARKYSEDPSAVNNSGDLGYFTAMMLIYPFENAAYNLKDKGDISMPIRTRFGYHIISLTDKRPNRGDIKVRHIMIGTSPNDPLEKQKVAKAKVDSLHALLQRGIGFQELASQYSDHYASRANGGEMSPFNDFSEFPQEFKDAAFSLQKDGDFTLPFKTDYGWHIMQRVELIKLKSKKELESSIRDQIERDSRSEKSKDVAINKFKKDLKFKGNKNPYKLLSKYINDSALIKATVNATMLKADAATKKVFKVQDNTYTVAEWVSWIATNQEENRYPNAKTAAADYYKRFSDEIILNTYDVQLESRFPDFANISKEYKEGLLLYDVKEKKIWNATINDTAGQRVWYNTHTGNFMWKQRADAAIIDVKDKELAKQLKAELYLIGVQPKNIKLKPLTMDSLAAKYIKKDPLSVNYVTGMFERGEQLVLEKIAPWSIGVFDVGMFNDRYYLVKINAIEAPKAKDFDDVRGIVISQMQESEEDKWLKELKVKYPVKINQEVLNTIVTN